MNRWPDAIGINLWPMRFVSQMACYNHSSLKTGTPQGSRTLRYLSAELPSDILSAYAQRTEGGGKPKQMECAESRVAVYLPDFHLATLVSPCFKPYDWVCIPQFYASSMTSSRQSMKLSYPKSKCQSLARFVTAPNLLHRSYR
jgi:hypothetical protein